MASPPHVDGNSPGKQDTMGPESLVQMGSWAMEEQALSYWKQDSFSFILTLCGNGSCHNALTLCFCQISPKYAHSLVRSLLWYLPCCMTVQCSVFSCLVYSLAGEGTLVDFALRWCEVYRLVHLSLLDASCGIPAFHCSRCMYCSAPFPLLWSWISRSFVSLSLQPAMFSNQHLGDSIL